ncbi:MAG: hypothetical protein ABEJ93_02965 [Candidatus Nanohalobium sp.]
MAFCVLIINSLFDIFSEKGDVPDKFSLTAIAGGILFHSLYALETTSLRPLLFMLFVAFLYSLYGWLAYWKGLWGGADAMCLTAVGFAAPYSLNGPNTMFPVNFLINVMLIGFLYTIGFAFYKAVRSDSFFPQFKERVMNEKKRIPLEIIGAAAVSIVAYKAQLDPLIYFAALVAIIFLYRFLKVLENTEMEAKIPLEEVEEGDIVFTEKVDLEHTKKLNMVGLVLGKLENRWNSNLIEKVKNRYGYSDIVGLDSKGLETLRKSSVEEVKVKEGIRFVPVFPAALLVTDIAGGGLMLLLTVF